MSNRLQELYQRRESLFAPSTSEVSCDLPNGMTQEETIELLRANLHKAEKARRKRERRAKKAMAGFRPSAEIRASAKDATLSQEPPQPVNPFMVVGEGEEAYYRLNSALSEKTAKRLAAIIVNDIAIYDRMYLRTSREKSSVYDEYDIQVERDGEDPIDVVFDNPRIIHKALKRAPRGIGYQPEVDKDSQCLQFALYDLVHSVALEQNEHSSS